MGLGVRLLWGASLLVARVAHRGSSGTSTRLFASAAVLVPLIACGGTVTQPSNLEKTPSCGEGVAPPGSTSSYSGEIRGAVASWDHTIGLITFGPEPGTATDPESGFQMFIGRPENSSTGCIAVITFAQLATADQRGGPSQPSVNPKSYEMVDDPLVDDALSTSRILRITYVSEGVISGSFNIALREVVFSPTAGSSYGEPSEWRLNFVARER